MIRIIVLLGFLAFCRAISCPNDCSGHGTCATDGTYKCSCYDGWGSTSDVAVYKPPDCSERICPSGRAWIDLPTSATTAHALAECSNMGKCDRSVGECSCFTGYTGDACQRTTCPDDCNGHGECVSMRMMATMDNAIPVGPNYQYYGLETTTTWDEDKIYGCVCDSRWDVGTDSGEHQLPEFFSSACSMIHCPSGDDPMTSADETDCEMKRNNGVNSPRVQGTDISFASGTKTISSTSTDLSVFDGETTIYIRYASNSGNNGQFTVTDIGTNAIIVSEALVDEAAAENVMIGLSEAAAGNLCHIDCSNRGTCDYETGSCTCFTGHYGEDCTKIDANFV
eukprot:TRINITY_DN773057_c0_g1_i1.p1 TRINITY_DN773057_c0_g1~~TRINITY_DN773057_c0_g1_i1.p1  ORF type:complete len:338 (-),score=63.64 TRINITY_DN773057_c0_g1_i1:189-1202(-)